MDGPLTPLDRQLTEPFLGASAVGTDEDKEGGLKHILGRVGGMQDTPKYFENHRAVTAEECRERLVTTPGHRPLGPSCAKPQEGQERVPARRKAREGAKSLGRREQRKRFARAVAWADLGPERGFRRPKGVGKFWP
jgi:hypothetical protein